MISSNNNNISSRSVLPGPGAIRSELPLSYDDVKKILESRQEICDVFDGKSDKFILITGPCSIHNADSAIEYANRLKELNEKVSDKIILVMRAYFEKPRTTVGWKGFIYDPDLNFSYDVEKGIFLARKLLLRIIDIGLPVATEMLDPIIAQYIADCVSWSAIGARTTEAQTHRQLASGLSMPVGFKNATDGTFQTAIDAMATARSAHSFIGVMEDGHVGVFRTKGNPNCHIVLRGGAKQGNYSPEFIAFLKVAMTRVNLAPNIIVDCSHANSNKDYRQQYKVLNSVLEQLEMGETCLKGIMLESHLTEGSQKLISGQEPMPDISVTDGCIGWEETVKLVEQTYEVLKKKESK